jgi:mannose-1-phosphate guanylyltransferase
MNLSTFVKLRKGHYNQPIFPMNNDYYCIIMAGGVGSRFWPLSRNSRPKQFLDILGTGKTLLRMTYDRFLHICPPGNILIITGAEHGDLVREQIPELSDHQLLLEPLRKNTGPCIAYASYRIQKINPHARVVVAPSDHLITKEEEFYRVIQKGLEFVDGKDALLTLGIKPSRIETGYGYIQVTNGHTMGPDPDVKKVKTFTEKPDYELAKVFFESGEFYWNSGIFIWSLPAIMNAFEKNLPEIGTLFSERAQFIGTEEEASHIREVYASAGSISIDYGVMEKAGNVYVLCADFGWTDLGTWGSLFEQLGKDSDSNVINGENVLLYDVKGCIVKMEENKLAVLQGLENFIVVESNNVLLICRKADEQKIKQFVNDVRIEKGDQYI